MKTLSLSSLSFLLFLAFTFDGVALAQNSAIKSLFRKRDAKSLETTDLELTTEQGPWLIFAHRFDGDDAANKATDLARELRANYGLTAYTFAKKFDYGNDTVQGNGITEDGKPRRMKYLGPDSVEFVAVLVGDFADAENPRFEETMKIIKCARPKSLGLDGSNPGKDYRGTWADLRKSIMAKKATDVKPGPMVMAFGTSNPMLPKDFFKAPIVDKFVKSLNSRSEVAHSLLENKGRFTVRIATFRGEDAVSIRNQSNVPTESLEGTALVKAEELASLAVKLLRDQGHEAYQFHDRNSSMVTIGAFENIGQNNENGQFVYANDIQNIIRQFGGPKEMRPSQNGMTVPVAKTILDVLDYRKIAELNSGSEKEKLRLVKRYSIPLELNPTVMAVPKVEKKSIYGGSLLGQR